MARNLFLQLCEELDVPHTQSFTNRLFDEHPYKYSLYGLSRMLADYGVESRGVRCSDKTLALTELETPFVAQVSGDLAVITAVTGTKVSYRWYDEVIHLSREQFLTLWSGVALLLFPSDTPCEPQLAAHRHAEQIQSIKEWGAVGCVAAILGIAAIYQAPHYSLVTLSFFLQNVAGLYLCYLLLLRQLKIASSTANRLCNLLKHSTCTDLLDSPAAKTVLGISWSEMGTAYFGVNALVMILEPRFLPILVLFAFATMGYTVWSLWYQRFRAHTWCTLCLMVQAVFALQALTSLIYVLTHNTLPDTVSISYTPFDFLSYLAATLSLHLLLPVIKNAQQSTQWKYKLRTLKLRQEVFDLLLHKEPHYELAPPSCIRFGNPDARYHLSILTNPYCNPCAVLHQKMHELNRLNCCLEMIFTSFGPGYDRTSRLLIAAYLQLGADHAWEIYGNWYSGGRKQQEAFFESFRLDSDSEAVQKEYEQHTAWREQTDISATPTLLVNGYRMPKDYQIEDFIDMLKIEE